MDKEEHRKILNVFHRIQDCDPNLTRAQAVIKTSQECDRSRQCVMKLVKSIPKKTPPPPKKVVKAACSRRQKWDSPGCARRAFEVFHHLKMKNPSSTTRALCKAVGEKFKMSFKTIEHLVRHQPFLSPHRKRGRPRRPPRRVQTSSTRRRTLLPPSPTSLQQPSPSSPPSTPPRPPTPTPFSTPRLSSSFLPVISPTLDNLSPGILPSGPSAAQVFPSPTTDLLPASTPSSSPIRGRSLSFSTPDIQRCDTPPPSLSKSSVIRRRTISSPIRSVIQNQKSAGIMVQGSASICGVHRSSVSLQPAISIHIIGSRKT